MTAFIAPAAILADKPNGKREQGGARRDRGSGMHVLWWHGISFPRNPFDPKSLSIPRFERLPFSNVSWDARLVARRRAQLKQSLNRGRPCHHLTADSAALALLVYTISFHKVDLFLRFSVKWVYRRTSSFIYWYTDLELCLQIDTL